MKIAKIKIQNTLSALKKSNYARAESALIVSILKKSPITAERIANAEKKAIKAQIAKKAPFLEKYRLKAVR